ncbi:prepilin peptidase [Gluconobacter sp. Dm-62]|uniref:prepilin peptidase n=1 Tax=Gluconobacter sp. Dm-62 TaxID=2799804 RepID=UPI001B8B0C8B|nr:A24 family peptidase [Gluconobacter sp. Dm-62]MBS1103328.1 prepilin peptidase [Gluconobacter sp. Dm-62]
MEWVVVLFAPVIGSFLGVLIRRLPRKAPIVVARSCCETCGKALEPRDLVPLLSFVLQRGRCRFCGSHIDPFHPAIELAAMAVAVSALAVRGTGDPAVWWDVALGWTLLTLAWIDAESLRLPDVLTLPLLLAGLCEGGLSPDGLTLLNRTAAALAGWGGLAGIAFLYRRIRHRAGLGGGDAKLLAAGGAWVGLEAIPNVLLGAACCGLVLAVILARGKKRNLAMTTMIPFGPCLALAIWAVRLGQIAIGN